MPPGCRRYCLPSRPATQPPIDIDVPGDPAIQTPPNFTSMCAMKSSTTYPKIASRSDTGRRGSNSQCRLLAVLDLSCAPDERPHHDPTNRSPFQLVRMDDDVEKRYENMKSKTRALSNII
ncbi:hypothetical protein EJB05_34042, partial [Eragrostis curvula]